uniref:Uncharacterized protein n=1 Tax=Ceratitis capitata TaxID=7213 RepID=W8CDF6_CERCA
MACCKEKDTQYRPDFRGKALTEKFYARHDQLTLHGKYKEKYDLYASNIRIRQSTGVRDHRLTPLTENQIYGWLSHLAEDYSTGYDPYIFRHHYHTHETIRTQLRIFSEIFFKRKL